MADLECPYCDADNDVNHDDGAGYAEGVAHQMQCRACEKFFIFETEISFYYTQSKANCLNDGDHVWEVTKTVPRKYSRLRCVTCKEERPLPLDHPLLSEHE